MGFGVESLSCLRLFFDESFLLTPSFSPEKRKNICAATLWIPDRNISILLKLVNRNFQKERVKEVGCLLHLSDFLTRSSIHHINLNLSRHVFGKTFPTAFQ